MIPKSYARAIFLFAIVLFVSMNNSCTKEPIDEQKITGEYCTFRDGITGPISSQVSIVADSSENFDYIISNISGYPNSSHAFLDIGCEKVLDRLVILEYAVTVGPNQMLISGDGDIMEDGTIHFNFTIKQDTETEYQLFLNSNTSASLGTYTDDIQNVSIKEDEITFALSGTDASNNFKVNDFSNTGCGIVIPRQMVASSENNSMFEIESELFYTGNNLVGELRLSTDNWQNVDTIELDVQ